MITHIYVGESVQPRACWLECGSQGGYCPSVCGEEGFCCRFDYPGCPHNVSKYYMSTEFHSCVKASVVEGNDCPNSNNQICT